MLQIIFASAMEHPLEVAGRTVRLSNFLVPYMVTLSSEKEPHRGCGRAHNEHMANLSSPVKEINFRQVDRTQENRHSGSLRLLQNIDRCTPLGGCGAYGAPFKLSCAVYGYTVIGKGK
jgi:hypothetical protein